MGKFVDRAAREIQATLDGMEEAYADRDLDPFVGYFTDDIVAMPSGMAPIVGVDAWRELLTGFFGGPALSNRVTKSEDITVVGDWAIEWHTEAATYTSKESGESNRVYNKRMFMFHKSAAMAPADRPHPSLSDVATGSGVARAFYSCHLTRRRRIRSGVGRPHLAFPSYVRYVQWSTGQPLRVTECPTELRGSVLLRGGFSWHCPLEPELSAVPSWMKGSLCQLRS